MNKETACEILAALIEAGEKQGGLSSLFRVAELVGPEYLAELEAACLEALKTAEGVLEKEKL